MSNKSLDGVLTKKAHTREKFSEEQIQDLVECSNSKTGFEYFAKKFFFIQHPVEGNQGAKRTRHAVLFAILFFEVSTRSWEKFEILNPGRFKHPTLL